MSGYEEAFGKPASEAPAAVVETPAAPEVAPAVVVETPQAAPVAPAETPAPIAPSPEQAEHSVPLPVLLRTRDELGGKLTQAEQRALAAERQLQEILKKQEEATAQMPHPLDAPEEFASWLLKRQQDAVNKAVGSLSQRQMADREEISRSMVEQQLGPEKFSELKQFIDQAPDRAHATALQQAHPYGWFLQQFNRMQEDRRAREALKQLDGRSIDDIVAERVAQELAKRSAAPEAAPVLAEPQRPRNPDGTFASSSQPERHQPVSLSLVNGAPAPRGSEARSGYDAAFRKG